MHSGWTIIADEIVAVERWKIICLAAIYFIPFLKILTLPFECEGKLFVWISGRFGALEEIVSPARNWIVTPYLAFCAAWHVWRGIESHSLPNFVVSAVAIALIAIGRANEIAKRRDRMRLLEFVKSFPFINPNEFFEYLSCASGIFRQKFPNRPHSMIDPSDINFEDPGKTRYLGIMTLARGVWDTIWLTRLTVMAGKFRGAKFMKEVASALCIIWGARIAALSSARVTVEGKELLPPAGEGQIFLYTHASFLDFAFAPLVLAARAGHEKRANFCPIFLIAKDHFIDNPIFHKFLGIGRAAKALGMIFVDRKASDKISEARRVASDAAHVLIQGKANLAIFPQGTRAAGFKGPNGERKDAGYYTVGTKERIRTHGGHLKKGASHIAVRAARELMKSGKGGRVAIVPIAITGAATACPKKSLRILPNVHVRLRVGETIIVDPSSIDRETEKGDTEAARIVHEQIDTALKNALHIHAELERRFFEDIRKMLDPMKIDEVAIAMKPWRGEDYLLHSILDAIYACKPNLWRGFLGELTHLILNFADRSEFMVLKSKIADSVPL